MYKTCSIIRFSLLSWTVEYTCFRRDFLFSSCRSCFLWNYSVVCTLCLTNPYFTLTFPSYKPFLFPRNKTDAHFADLIHLINILPNVAFTRSSGERFCWEKVLNTISCQMFLHYCFCNINDHKSQTKIWPPSPFTKRKKTWNRADSVKSRLLGYWKRHIWAWRLWIYSGCIGLVT